MNTHHRSRQLLFIAVVFVAILFAGPHARAAGTDMATRYAGSFIAEVNAGQRFYWYVLPEKGERYAIPSMNDFSRLLSKVGTGVTQKQLRVIPDSATSTSPMDYQLVKKLKGSILLYNQDTEQAWYLDPMDSIRYRLRNNDEGFATMKRLSHDLNADRLVQIPITTELGYDHQKYTFSSSDASTAINADEYGIMYDTLLHQHLYQDTFTGTDLFYGSLKGMAEATKDAYTEFYPPVKNKQQQDYFQGDSSIEGIGAMINSRDKSIYIVSTLKGSPAERAGLRSKDEIIAVDSMPTQGLPVDKVVTFIKGPAGTSVVLTIYRPSSGVTSDYTIVREKIDVPSVEGETLDNDVAYFKFSLFTTTLVPEFQKLAAKLITEKTKGIIVDMRDNLGGVTQSSVHLASFWLPSDKLIMTEKRLNRATEYMAGNETKMPVVPTVILTNEETASASEIFTSALQYYKKATVIGTKTYGKGTGQNLINFEDGAGLKFTTFEWLPPDGKSINKVGITPDIIVQPSVSSDVQLDAAERFIKYGF